MVYRSSCRDHIESMNLFSYMHNILIINLKHSAKIMRILLRIFPFVSTNIPFYLTVYLASVVLRVSREDPLMHLKEN